MELVDILVARGNYWVYIVLMMVGMYAMIAKNNLIKKLIGMSIFQTAIILFYVSIGVKENATIPILKAEDIASAHGAAQNERAAIQPREYTNPLPHVLMLTAIVVGVSTLGVGLAVAQKVHREYGTLEENEILERIKTSNG